MAPPAGPPPGGGLATHTVGTLVWLPADGGAAWRPGEVTRVLPSGRLAVRAGDDGGEVEVDPEAAPLQNPASRLGVEVRGRKGEPDLWARARLGADGGQPFVAAPPPPPSSPRRRTAGA